jgi:hypothetical protein
MTPLPRSLAPLPHETLPGFLLRLAHRLDVSPLQVAIRTGLSTDRGQQAVPARVLVTLPAEAITAFAQAARLTVAEVTDLTLASLAARYPPLDASLVRHRRQRRTGPPLRDPWVFTRYCADCLRGDDSLIQRRHGGAWSKYWRLPVVFACPTHQRLLEHAFPACGVLALTRPANLARPLPMAGHRVTHPAACRNPDPTRPAVPCGYRLDHPTASGDGIPRPQPDQRLLRLQEQLLCLLDGDDATAHVFGQPTTASRYFVDLRIIAGLLHAGWPAARDLVDPVDATVVDRHIATVHARLPGGGRYPMQPHDTPPPDAATTAAVLACADRILTAEPDAVCLLARAAFSVLPASSDWVKSFLPGDGHCSPALANVVGAEARAAHVIRKLGIPHRTLGAAGTRVHNETRY